MEQQPYVPYLEQFESGYEIDALVRIVDNIVFSEKTHYGVYSVENHENRQFNICGVFPAELIPWVEYRIQGVITVYKGDKQVSVRKCEVSDLHNEDTIRRILMRLNGFSAYFNQILERFGKDSITVFMEQPELIMEAIPEAGKEKVLEWREVLLIDASGSKVVDALVQFGIDVLDARAALGLYGIGLLDTLSSNPYELTRLIPRLTFRACDAFALAAGMSHDDPRRIQEIFLHILSEFESRGHCYAPIDEIFMGVEEYASLTISSWEAKNYLVKNKYKPYKRDSFTMPFEQFAALLKNALEKKEKTITLFCPTEEMIRKAAADLSSQERIVVRNDLCFKKEVFEAEAFVASRIAALAPVSSTPWEYDPEPILDQYLGERDIKLEEKQRQAVLAVVQDAGGVFVIQGGPGSGKTFISKIILDVLAILHQQCNISYSPVLLAPTGRASKVLRDSTGYEAQTIHRGLECSSDGIFLKNTGNPFRSDVLLLDESSMLDILLARDLFSALLPPTKVILVGDVHQLPSIEPGNVLADIIKSEEVRVLELDVSKRQVEGSSIIRNSRLIMESQMIHSDTSLKDTYVIRKSNAAGCLKVITDAINDVLVAGGTLSDVQILSPVKRGSLGTTSLNYYIQKKYNPENEKKPQVLKGKIRIYDENGKPKEVNSYFRQGDKVIHTKNDYQMQWYFEKEHLGYSADYEKIGITNGECGIIQNIFITEEMGRKKVEMYVNYDGNFACYRDDFSNLEHAFAITIHKSQGSQWPVTVMPIFSAGDLFMSNNMLYTGFTRAEKISVVVGDPDFIKKVINTNSSGERNTSLSEQIKFAFNERRLAGRAVEEGSYNE